MDDAGLIPLSGENLVPRPALWAQLDQAHAALLTLVCAPGGYGKTTSVASWLLRQRESPEWANTRVAWCNLSTLDSDLHHFVARLIAPIQAVSPDACTATQRTLEEQLDVKTHYLAQLFVKDIAALPVRTLIVLDDYHHITEPAVHTFFEQVISQAALLAPALPLKVIVLSRTLLPFSVVRLQSQRRFVEFRVQDLKMNSAESEQLLSVLLATPLTADAVTLLQQYVEGWAAGICLLALSLRNQPDIGRWLATIGKRPNAYIASYFMDEVLATQPKAVQDFLQVTSLLPVLDTSLCTVALGDQDEQQSRALLDYIVHNGLFVTPLDEMGGAYRYHDLFQSMLQERLRASLSSKAIDEILGRIAGYYATLNDLERAVETYLAGHAPDKAVSLLELQIPRLRDHEEWHLLYRLLNRLPVDRVERNPALLLARAWIYEYDLQTARVRTILAQVTVLLSELQKGMESGHFLRLWSEAELLAIAPMVTVSTLEETERRTDAALAYFPPDDLFLRSKIMLFTARQFQRLGRIDDALDRLDEEARGVGAQSIAYLTRLLFARQMVLLHEGRMTAAEHTIGLYLRLAEQAGLPMTSANAHMAAASIYYATGQDELALEHCRAVAAQPFPSNLTTREVTALYMVEIYGRRGDAAAAAQVAAHYVSLAMSLGDEETLAVAQMLEAAALIFAGQAQAAQGWLDSLNLERLSPFRPYSGWVWGCGILALGNRAALANAGVDLAALIERCKKIRYVAWTVKLLVLLARIEGAQGKLIEGAAAFSEAVRLSDPRSHQRSLLDPDPVLDAVLVQALKVHRQDVNLCDLLQETQRLRQARSLPRDSQFPAPAALPPPHAPGAGFRPNEPLTERELEILRLLDARLTNKEIGQQLSISVNTVRNHSARIYEKLDADGWLAATQRARQLGLLPQ